MRLASHSRVDPSDTTQFPWPVKLNRKFPPRLKEEQPRAGDPVVDSYGRPILVPPPKSDFNDSSTFPAYDRKKTPLLWPSAQEDPAQIEELIARLEAPRGPQADASLIGPSNTSNNATRAKAGLFKKRVREIHKSSADARRTYNEEALPWVLEDHETEKEWEGRRKESTKGLKALQEALKLRHEGHPFPTLPSLEEEQAAKAIRESGQGVKKEDPEKDDVKPQVRNENHAPWIGKLEGEAHGSGSTADGGAVSHALFVFDERGAGGFRVVPVSRMYKFIQKPKHASKLDWEEAEKAFEKHQKARMGEGISKWMTRNDDGTYMPVARRGNGESSVYGSSSGLSLPGSFGARSAIPSLDSIYNRDSSARRDTFMSVSGDRKRGPVVKDEEGTYGEIDFEEDFADDEERNEGDDYAMGEEETKELEQRMKRELARAEEQRDNEEGDLDDLFDDKGPGHGENDVLTGSGKQMKKIMRALARREGNDIYDDDDEERNPYMSEDSDEEDESVMANPEEVLRQVREEKEREAKEAAKLQQQQQQSNGQSKAPSKDTSRSGTPVPKTERPVSSQGKTGQTHRPGAGHASLAQRATSPNRTQSRSGSPERTLKRKSDISGSNTPASGSTSGKRARTGTGQSISSRTSSPGAAGSPRSASPSRSGGRASSLTDLEREIIQLVRSGKVTTTKELISHFAPRLSTEGSSLKRSLLEGASRVLATRKPEGTLEVRSGLAE